MKLFCSRPVRRWAEKSRWVHKGSFQPQELLKTVNWNFQSASFICISCPDAAPWCSIPVQVLQRQENENQLQLQLLMSTPRHPRNWTAARNSFWLFFRQQKFVTEKNPASNFPVFVEITLFLSATLSHFHLKSWHPKSHRHTKYNNYFPKHW